MQHNSQGYALKYASHCDAYFKLKVEKCILKVEQEKKNEEEERNQGREGG